MDDWLPVVSNRVEADHDPSLAPPRWLDPKLWTDFSRADQARVLDVTQRFDPWADGAAAERIAALKDSADATTSADVEDAFAHHFSDTGWKALEGSLHFRYLRDDLRGARHADGRIAAAEALLLDAAAVAQWDLYHRAQAPDIIAFHGGHTPLEDRRRNIRERFRLYAGYSWTPILDPSAGFGPTPYAIRLPIRLVVVSWWAPYGASARKVAHQHEVAPRDRMVLDPAVSTAFQFGSAMTTLIQRFAGDRAPRPGREWPQLLASLP